MKTILCIDLDQTLLARDDEIFLPKSIDEICRSIKSMPADLCMQRMISAIEKMIYRETISPVLYDVFLSEFVNGYDRSRIAAEFADYYEKNYGDMREYTSLKPEGIQLIRDAFERGYEIVIATNPIYPLNAIQERLRWAGLGNYLDRFLMITTMEEFHFAKPDPAYYAEILGKLGCREETRILMIGDSLEMDIIPASKVGIAGYWLNDKPLPAGLSPHCAHGGYEGIFTWIDQIDDQNVSDMAKMSDIDLIAFLKAAPAVFDSVCRSVTIETGCNRPDVSEWSLVEIVCHLRDTDRDVNLPRFADVFLHDNSFITHIDTACWADERNYRDENGHDAVQEFCSNRLKLIRSLAEHADEWHTRTARHSIFGPVKIDELIQFMVTHDRMHIRQACDTLAKVKGIQTLKTTG